MENNTNNPVKSTEPALKLAYIDDGRVTTWECDTVIEARTYCDTNPPSLHIKFEREGELFTVSWNLNFVIWYRIRGTIDTIT